MLKTSSRLLSRSKYNHVLPRLPTVVPLVPVCRVSTATSFAKLASPQFCPARSTRFLSNPTPTMSTIPNRARPSIPSETLASFISSMSSIYGPFPTDPTNWTPPDLKDDCHNGRYLWTDAFGVINFITLYSETSDAKWLNYAETLVSTVHSTLGKKRDGSSWLSSENKPLTGGLRIGKKEENGDDCDGQYWHYLVLWVFALLRLHTATSKQQYAVQARVLGAAMYKGFILNVPGPTLKERPRIPWKISTDGGSTLVSSEGNLDPYDGLVIFSKLKNIQAPVVEEGEEEEGELEICISKGYEYCKKRVDSKWRSFHSNDPLDLGMAMWTSSWAVGEEWAELVRDKCVESVLYLNRQNYFTHSSRRLAFREFGTAMGLKCASARTDAPTANMLLDIAASIFAVWEVKGIDTSAHLTSINTVMYAAALWPGAFREGFFDSD